MKDIVGYVVVSSVSWKRIDFGRERFLLKFFFCPFFLPVSHHLQRQLDLRNVVKLQYH